MYDRNTQSNMKCVTAYTGKPHPIKCRENNTYPCFCNRLFDFVHTEGLSISNGDLQCSSKHRRICLDSKEKATQMETNKKNIYDAYILDGLLKSNINKPYVKVDNSDSILNDHESLTDIKEILVTANHKLDLILKALTEKCNNKHKEHNKHNKRMRTKTVSALTLPIQSGLSDLPNLMKTHPHCISSTYLPNLRAKEHTITNLSYVSPYNAPYSMYGINRNYYNKFGLKYSEKTPNNVWNPFVFMATNIDTKQIKLKNCKDKIAHYDKNNNPEKNNKDSLHFYTSMEQLSGDQD